MFPGVDVPLVNPAGLVVLPGVVDDGRVVEGLVLEPEGTVDPELPVAGVVVDG